MMLHVTEFYSYSEEKDFQRNHLCFVEDRERQSKTVSLFVSRDKNYLWIKRITGDETIKQKSVMDHFLKFTQFNSSLESHFLYRKKEESGLVLCVERSASCN